MKKGFKFYLVAWAILLAVWCAVVFLVRPILPEYTINYDARFWIAWGFILVAFIGNLICANIAFRAENLKKMFYNLPLVTISWTALICMLVAGSALMLIPGCPAWVAAVVCAIILAFNAISVIKAAAAASIVNQVDEKIKTKTSFIRSMTVEAVSIMARAKSDEVKAECKKVYEALRYSDPMSSPELAGIEAKIEGKMEELEKAVEFTDEERIHNLSHEILMLIDSRNSKIKEAKQ